MNGLLAIVLNISNGDMRRVDETKKTTAIPRYDKDEEFPMLSKTTAQQDLSSKLKVAATLKETKEIPRYEKDEEFPILSKPTAQQEVSSKGKKHPRKSRNEG
ncbi:hypothetical protein HAX54_007337 [Datura stramonium]|uniref:Uncharacterized protein n=1 Tax=Datura stramonium TaxID=4076 RepID=A0ABS8TD45_DATST|nr:hypothetical protein [Datura stramonium]